MTVVATAVVVVIVVVVQVTHFWFLALTTVTGGRMSAGLMMSGRSSAESSAGIFEADLLKGHL
jgi:hypothetical protein